MKPALGQITEVAGPMATERAVAMVEIEVADLEEEDREDIKSTSFITSFNNILVTLNGYWQSADYG
jgi:hypothetical protein